MWVRIGTLLSTVLLTAVLATPVLSQDFRTPTQAVEDQLTFLAEGLSVEYFSREVGQDWDQMVFWPHNSDNPTHLIACIEERLECLSGTCGDPFVFGDKLTPSVQLIDLATRGVTAIVRGMTICDGIRTTPWGTVLATEEDFDSDTGSAYEILDPITTNVYTVLDRGSGGAPATIVDQTGADASAYIVKHTALPVIRYEGFVVDDSGVIIAGDEERPGSYEPGDTDGGAIYKFIPTSLHNGGTISSLDQSPLGSGTIYALQVSCRDDQQQFGQGCEIGAGAWIALTPAPASEDSSDEGTPRIGREAAQSAGATAYYRPEDLHVDPQFGDANSPHRVRFCFAATGNKSAANYGEVQCAIDSDITAATGETGQVVINRFVEGNPDLNQPDNLAFQPVTNNLYVIEDNSGGADVWACLPDGADTDIKTDGCVKVLTLADTSAEPTGFIFTPDGKQAYVNIQHSADGNMPLVDDFRTDDLILVSGFDVGTYDSSADFGRFVENELADASQLFFGFGPTPSDDDGTNNDPRADIPTDDLLSRIVLGCL